MAPPRQATEPASLVVLVGHEDELVAQGLARCAERTPGVLAYVVNTLDEMLDAVARATVRAVVWSERLLAELPGPDMAERLADAADHAQTPLVVVSSTCDDASAAVARRAGAHAHVTLSAAPSALPATLSLLLGTAAV